MKGKNVLLITPIIFHYHLVLRKEFIKLGATVYFYPDQPKGALTSLKRKLYPSASKGYYAKILKEIEGKKIDFFLLINGKGITRDFIIQLRKKNSTAKFVTYQWDSLKRNNAERNSNFLYFLDLFDSSFSFDYDDVTKINELEYYPNFHTINFDLNLSREKHIDLLMVASYTDERYNFVKENKELFKEKGYNLYCYLYVSWHQFLRIVILRRKFINPKYLKFKILNQNELTNLYLSSKATLDIPYKGQSGFTMRIIESLAYKCNVYTTNENLRREKFYSENSIIIFNNSNFWQKFSEQKNVKTQKMHEVVKRLYIKNWITKIVTE